MTSLPSWIKEINKYLLTIDDDNRLRQRWNLKRAKELWAGPRVKLEKSKNCNIINRQNPMEIPQNNADI